ncbi:MAG: hypothetical protein ACK5JT_19435, partial [Hyphomicrobiaceae bacterium]
MPVIQAAIGSNAIVPRAVKHKDVELPYRMPLKSADGTQSSHYGMVVRRVRSRLRRLYFGTDLFARSFRLVLLSLDIALLLYFVIGSFYDQADWHRYLDVVIAILLVVEWLLRLWIYDARLSFFKQLSNWADI